MVKYRTHKLALNLKADEVVEKIKKDSSITFIEDVCVELNISRTTFYSYFPSDSEDYKKIKEAIDQNKYIQKKEIRKMWKIDANDRQGRLYLYKLLGNNEDRQKLSMQHIKHEGGTNDSVTVVADTKEDAEEIQEMLKELKDQETQQDEGDTDI
jgi:AcrR family transcriptional regulator